MLLINPFLPADIK